MNAYIAGREIDLHSIDEWACMYRITMYGDSDINSVLHIADEFRNLFQYSTRDTSSLMMIQAAM